MQLQVILKTVAGRCDRPIPGESHRAWHRLAQARYQIRGRQLGNRRRWAAWGIGWQVMLDGLEITQFTYFQQCGGIDLDLVAG